MESDKMKEKCIAIITARGGSKRIPRKNMKEFLGKPILAYSIEAAVKSGCFAEVMVSTDDEEIASTARSCGASVPFLRSEENSNDFATTSDVILEVLRKYKDLGKEYEYFCCIYPTAPFITAQKIESSFRLIRAEKASSLIPVVRFGFPIQRALKIEKGRLEMIAPENLNKRSQDLMPAYHDAGQFYWCRSDAFLREGKILTANTYAFELPESEVQDIDNSEDWKIAEIKYKIMLIKIAGNHE